MNLNQITQEVKQLPWKRYLFYALVAVGILAALSFSYKLFWPRKAPVQGFIVAAPAEGMPEAPTESVTVTVPLRTYNKQVAAKKMNLPPEIVADPKKEILTTATVPASEGGYTAATVLDTETGVSQTIIKEIPRPWFALGGQTEVGVRAGIGTNGTAAVVYARQDVFRVGKVNVAAYGEAGMNGDKAGAAAMVDVSIRW